MSKVLTDTDYAALKGALETARDHDDTTNYAAKLFKNVLAKLSPGVTTYDDLRDIFDEIDSCTREDYFDHLAYHLPGSVQTALGYEF